MCDSWFKVLNSKKIFLFNHKGYYRENEGNLNMDCTVDAIIVIKFLEYYNDNMLM